MKRMIMWMMLVACLAIGAAPLQAAAATNSSLGLFINGEPVTLEESTSPILEKNRTLVPVRVVFEELGLNVDWNKASKTALITNDDVTIEMKLGEKKVTVNGKEEKVDVSIMLKQDHLFIPLRFVSEQAGLEVDWSQKEQTVYLEPAPTGNQVEDSEAFLKQLIEANTKLNSYSATMDIKQFMTFDGETMDMDMNMKMDVVLDPLGLYQHMTMSMEELDGEDISSESYVTKDGFYTYDSESDQWIKYDDEMVESLIGMSEAQMDPTAQFELMTSYIEDLRVFELEDSYEMYFNVSGEGFQDLLDLLLNMPELGLDEEGLEEFDFDIKINKMSIVTTVDKETLFPISDRMNSDMTMMMDDEKMRIIQKATSSYSNYNKVEEIVIPQEVIDSAISFEEYLEQLEQEIEIEDDEIMDEAV